MSLKLKLSTFLINLFFLVECLPGARNLFDDLFIKRHIDPKIRPVVTLDTPIIIYMNLSLSQILEVNVKSQILILNVWVYQEWKDRRFTWDPKSYGGLMELQLPSNSIWLPDLVLYNNAGDNWDLSTMSGSKVKIRHDGNITWKPPVILKSQCDMDVTYFPFDIQTCQLKMGTWTHNGLLIDLRHVAQKNSDLINDRKNFDNCQSTVDYAVDLSDYLQSFEWDLLDISATRNIKKYPCCPEPYLDVTFQIKIRRMTLFYGLNLICPCLSISFLAVMVFYLPSYSAQKMTLCISVFLGLHIFILVVFDLTPSTSRSVPLIVKYLLFTMFMVTISSIASIAVVQVTFRQPENNKIPRRIRKLFLQILPRYLLLSPMILDQVDQDSTTQRETNSKISSFDKTWLKWNEKYNNVIISKNEDILKLRNCKKELALESLRSIKQHFDLKNLHNQRKDEWVFLGIVLDRILLIIFSILVTLGTVIIFLQPPQLWNKQASLSADNAITLYSKLNYTRLCK